MHVTPTRQRQVLSYTKVRPWILIWCYAFLKNKIGSQDSAQVSLHNTSYRVKILPWLGVHVIQELLIGFKQSKVNQTCLEHCNDNSDVDNYITRYLHIASTGTQKSELDKYTLLHKDNKNLRHNSSCYFLYRRVPQN